MPQRWLKIHQTGPTLSTPVCRVAAEQSVEELVREVHHSSGHPGVRRTLYFVKRREPQVTRRQVHDIVVSCQVCRSINPAPVKWRKGHLGVDGVWQRVEMDITHFEGRHYLTLVDCGPSRFAVWRPLKLQTSSCVTEQLEAVFCERGTPRHDTTVLFGAVCLPRSLRDGICVYASEERTSRLEMELWKDVTAWSR